MCKYIGRQVGSEQCTTDGTQSSRPAGSSASISHGMLPRSPIRAGPFAVEAFPRDRKQGKGEERKRMREQMGRGYGKGRARF